MQRWILISVIFLSLLARESYAQYTPLDRCVRDSLYRLMPHKGQVQKAEIDLEIARLIWDTLPEQAFRNIETALKISIQENNCLLKARARMFFGDYFSRKRKFMLAQEHYLAASSIYHMSKDIGGELNILVLIGSLNSSLANNDKALSFFEKGLKLAKSTNNPVSTGIFLDHLAATYQSNKAYETAFKFYNAAVAVYHQAGDSQDEFIVRNNIGSLYLDQGKNDEALDYYQELLKMADSGEKGLMGTVFTRLGHVYFQKKDYRNSLLYNKKALDVREKLHSHEEVNSSLINIGGDFYMMGKPDSGKIYLDRGLRLAIQNDRKNLVENCYRHLFRYYLQTGDYKSTLEYSKKYNAVRASIDHERNKNNFSILEANQEIDRIKAAGILLKTTHEIGALNESNQHNQLTFVKILTGLTAVLMIVFVFQLLYTRRMRWDVQKLNLQLSDEIKDRQETEKQTREREKQFRFLSENSVDFIIHMNSQRECSYSSPASVKIYGYTPDEIVQLSSSAMTDTAHVAYTEQMFQEMLDTREPQQFIYKAKKKDGTSFWVESILNPLFDPNTGVFKGMVGVTRDIQERKTKELEIMEGTKQKENLLKEIHHRVKNNFAILVSLINMQMAQTKNQELFQSLTNLQLRIRTMALVHEMLYRSKDFENISFSDYLRSLASVIAGTYNRRDIELTFEADESVMDIEASIPLGLIVNEILSNSYKHAFPDGRSGSIRISFKTDQISGNYCLILQDDGIGMPAGVALDQYKSMGLQVVQILCQQIEGDLELNNVNGTKFTITYKSPGK